MTYSFPAVFEKTDAGYSVSFPDLHGCTTEGTTPLDAFHMAKEALCVWLGAAQKKNDVIPCASSSDSFAARNGFVSFVEADTEDYALKKDMTPVRRSVSIPKWMDDKARESGLSLSHVLRDALAERLK